MSRDPAREDSGPASPDQGQAFDEGVSRPPTRVLPGAALIPAQNRIVPAPNQFTHQITEPTPFYYERAAETVAPDGQFAAGTKVVLLVHDGGQFCRVVDGQGLYVEIAHDRLRPLAEITGEAP